MYDNVLSLVSTLQNQGEQHILVEGVITSGSYHPSDNTVEVLLGHTYAAAAFQMPNGQQKTFTTVRASLAVFGYGDQYGPIGGERCLVAKCGTQFLAILEFDSDDSLNVPSGERWIVHRNPQNPTEITAYTKWTNDGATVGDGLSGFKNLVGGYAEFVTTDGLSIVMNDSAGTITLTNGMNTIVLSSSGVLINGASAVPANGLVRQSDLVAFGTNLITALTTWATLHLQGGTGASGPTFTYTPTGSTTAFSE